MDTTTLTVKVSAAFAEKYRAFCEEHCLQLGRFTEKALLDIMEDVHFGSKAQRVLARASGRRISHRKLSAATK